MLPSQPVESNPTRPSWSGRDFLFVILLSAATSAAYAPVLGNNFVNYDDDVYIYTNRHVREGLSKRNLAWAFTSFEASNWHPLTWLSLQVDASLSGRTAVDPRIFHATNLLLHIANSVLLYGFWRLATGSAWRSVLVASLFALHPLHVESVAWAAERKDVLSGFFGILTLLTYARYARRPCGARYAAVTVALILGLLSKPMLVTWPFVLVLLDYWPLRRWPAEMGNAARARHLVLEKAPWFALSAAVCVMTLLAQTRSGAVEALTGVSLTGRLGNALVAYVVYLGKTLCPIGLAPFYPHAGHHLPWWQPALAALSLGATTVLVLARRRQRAFAVGWLWYLGTLVPAIGVVQVGFQAHADRYTYLPLVGVLVMAAWVLAARSKPTGWEAACALGMVATCAAMTSAQVRTWRDSHTLWSHALAVTQDNFVAHMRLGDDLLMRTHDLQLARQHFEAAVAIKPDLAKGYNNLGFLDLAEEDWAGAATEFRRALAIDPRYARAHEGLGQALLRQGDLAGAVAHLEKAARLAPRQPEFLDVLAAAQAEAGHFTEAAASARRAIAAAQAAGQPDLARAIRARLALYEQGKPYRQPSSR